MYKYKLTYSNAKSSIKTFKTLEEANWFFHNEGDHLIKVERLYD
jgi:hypothetical protein